jgi:hypothetical protein
MMVGLGSDFWGNAIFVLPENVLLLEAEFLDTNIKIFPVILSLLGGSMAFLFYNFFFKLLVDLKLSFIGKKFYTFFNRKWFFDKIYNELLAQHTLTVAYEHGYQNIDRGIIELIGPNGIWQLFSPISNKLNYAFNFHLDTPKKLRSFFKILFITFLFIYLFIFGVWYLNAYETYIQLFIGSYFNKVDQNATFEQYPNNFFDLWSVSEIIKDKAFVNDLSNFTTATTGLPFFSLCHIWGYIDCLNILMHPFDNNLKQVPYLPFDERWIPNLKQFISDAMILSGWDGSSKGGFGFGPPRKPDGSFFD